MNKEIEINSGCRGTSSKLDEIEQYLLEKNMTLRTRALKKTKIREKKITIRNDHTIILF